MLNSLPISRYLETKPLESYPAELLKDMKMVSFFKDELATPFGSYIYRMQKYPGDVDLLEKFEDCCTADQVVRKFIKSLHRVVTDILKSKQHYFSEFKTGIDHRYDIDIGECNNGYYLMDPHLGVISMELFNRGLFDKDEIDKLMFIVDNDIHNGDAYDIVYNIYRNRRILRWTANEILRGYKMIGKMKKTLYDSLFDETHVKIDMLAYINNRYIEITNFIGLQVLKPDGESYYINVNLDENHDIQKYLPIEIEKLYFSNYYYSPFKMAKRIFSLSRNKNDVPTLEKIIPLVTSDISLLYQVKSEIDVLILIFERVKVPPIKTILRELDYMKGRITTILPMNEKFQLFIYDLIDSMKKASNDERLVILEKLNMNIKPYINYLTIKYLDRVGLNPPPSYLLPPDHYTYANVIRKPSNNPDVNDIFEQY
jgi:hypothetical protein